MFLKISQKLLESTCARASFVVMLRAVASIPSQECIKDKILTHVPAFLSSDSFLLCFLSLRSNVPFENFILCLRCGVEYISKAYSEPCQISWVEFFAKIVNDLKPPKNFILDIWQGSEYSFGWLNIILEVLQKNQYYTKSIDWIY